jgi:hypothetical protein
LIYLDEVFVEHARATVGETSQQREGGVEQRVARAHDAHPRLANDDLAIVCCNGVKQTQRNKISANVMETTKIQIQKILETREKKWK